MSPARPLIAATVASQSRVRAELAELRSRDPAAHARLIGELIHVANVLVGAHPTAGTALNPGKARRPPRLRDWPSAIEPCSVFGGYPCAMKYRQLGRTGLFVSELCLGTMTFGGKEGGFWRVIGELEQDEVDTIVARALAAGVNFFDTADVYSFGLSEKLLGQSLKNVGVAREDVVIATKVFGEMGPQPNNRGASRGHIMDSVGKSLERLQTDHIDLYQIHATDSVTPIDETLRALDDLVRQGLVRYVGVSNWTAWRIAKALGRSEQHGWERFETLQAYYSIAGRDLERELVPMLTEEKLGLLVWSPLAGGLLSGKFGPGAPAAEGARRTSFDFPPVDEDRAWACVAAMREVAAAREVSVARVALAYVLAKPFVTSVIIGAKNPTQLEDNLAATSLALTEDELATLDAVSALASEYPGWMLQRQNRARVPKPFEPDSE